jgi:hypothetical protein
MAPMALEQTLVQILYKWTPRPQFASCTRDEILNIYNSLICNLVFISMFKRRVSFPVVHFTMLGGEIPGKWAFLNQYISMAVPTGYQHQNRCEILIFISKYFGVTVMSPGYVWVHFWYIFGTFWVCMRPRCPEKILSRVWRLNKSAGSGVLFALFPTWDFSRLSWITIDFFYRRLKTRETHVVPVVGTINPKTWFSPFLLLFLVKMY